MSDYQTQMQHSRPSADPTSQYQTTDSVYYNSPYYNPGQAQDHITPRIGIAGANQNPTPTSPGLHHDGAVPRVGMAGVGHLSPPSIHLPDGTVPRVGMAGAGANLSPSPLGQSPGNGVHAYSPFGVANGGSYSPSIGGAVIGGITNGGTTFGGAHVGNATTGGTTIGGTTLGSSSSVSSSSSSTHSVSVSEQNIHQSSHSFASVLGQVPWMKFRVVAEPDMSLFASDVRVQAFIEQITQTSINIVSQKMMQEFEQVTQLILGITQSYGLHMETVKDSIIQQIVSEVSSGMTVASVTGYQTLGGVQAGGTGIGIGGYTGGSTVISSGSTTTASGGSTTATGSSTSVGGGSVTTGSATTGGGSATIGGVGGGSTTHGGGSTTTGGGSSTHGGNSTTIGGGSGVHGGGSTTIGGGSATHGGGSTTIGGGTATHPGGSTTTTGGNSTHHGGSIPKDSSCPRLHPDQKPVILGGPDITKANWIWSKDVAVHSTPDRSVRAFRKTITLKCAVNYATIDITGDNFYSLYVNGRIVGSGKEWNKPDRYTVHFAETTKVVIAVYAAQDTVSRGPVGLLAAGKVWHSQEEKPHATDFVTDDSWRSLSTDKFSPLFIQTDFDDHSWEKTHVQVAYGHGAWTHMSPVQPGRLVRKRLTSIKGVPDAPKAGEADVTSPSK